MRARLIDLIDDGLVVQRREVACANDVIVMNTR
jgi:hypothetical protein